MVLITVAAKAQLQSLERHYEKLGRNGATLRMTEAVAMAMAQIEEQNGTFFPARRPYPSLATYGWQWLKASRYWIAFTTTSTGYTITAVFFETSNIPRRLAR